MARSLNKVLLVGHLGADPEVRVTSTGQTVTTFSLATNRQWQGKDGSTQEETDWHTVVAWDRLAQICAEHLTKGRLVFVEGRLRYRSWESAGQKFYKTEIVASDMLILDSKGAAQPEYTEEDEDVGARHASPLPDARPARASAAVAAGKGNGRSRASAVAEPVAVEDVDELPF